jgi:hypothetical protein
VFGLSLHDSGQAPVACSCGEINDPLVSREHGKLLEYMSTVISSRRTLVNGKRRLKYNNNNNNNNNNSYFPN